VYDLLTKYQIKKEIDYGTIFQAVRQLNSQAAIAATIADWCDKFIVAQKIRPNMQGKYVFEVMASQLYYRVGCVHLKQSFRAALRKYGYYITIKRKIAIITRISDKLL